MTDCVITGMGSICSIGKNKNELWENAKKGLCGIKEIKSFDTNGCISNVGAQVENFENYKGTEVEGYDKISYLLIEATDEALKESKLDLQAEKSDRIAIVIGSCTGGIISGEKFINSYLKNEKINSADILGIPINCLGANIAEKYGIRGYVSNIGNACSASLASIIKACELIKNEIADIVIAGGGDTIASVPFSGFNALHALDSQPCSPFSGSKGLSLGEGVGIVIVESEEHAKKRNAKIQSYITGYTITSDAYHITAPRPDSMAQISSINHAFKMAGIEAKDIDYVNAHGTGTPANDKIEESTIEKVFGENSNKLSISSTKSLIGHCLGGAGVLGTILSIKALHDQIVPPTINFSTNERKKFDFVPNYSKAKELTNVLVNAFAFGGNNTSLVLSNKVGKKDTKDKKRVFIIGIGLVLPGVDGKDDYINNEDEDGKTYQVSTLDYKKVGVDINKMRRLDTLSKYSVISSLNALKDSNTNITAENRNDIGISFGTSDGPMNASFSYIEGIVKKGISNGSAFIFPNTVYNAAAGYVSIFTGIMGYTNTLVDGFHSGISAVCDAYDMVKNNNKSTMLCIGTDENSELIRLAYDSVGLTNKENDTKISEGSVSIVIANEDNIETDKQVTYGEILGYSILTDAVMIGKLPNSLERVKDVISKACENSGIELEDITHIEGFNNGNKYMKELEIQQYKDIFENHFNKININFVRERVGESRAAASLLQIVNGLITNNSIIKKTVLVTGYANGGIYSAIVIRV